MQTKTDFTLFDHGSILKLVAHSEAAKGWVDEHLPADRLTFGRGTIIEPRFIAPILDGISGDGLTVAGVAA